MPIAPCIIFGRCRRPRIFPTTFGARRVQGQCQRGAGNNVKEQLLLGAAMLAALTQPIYATPDSRQAAITGGPGVYGMCSIEVNVDGALEVEITGGNGLLRTLSGQQATS